MKTLTISIILALASAMLTGPGLSAQIPPDKDWPQFSQYSQANAELNAARGKIRPLAVLMGDSITYGWEKKDPTFFTEYSLVCRGISGQTSSQMLIRFRQDVINLNPKYVVIMAGTNDIAGNTGSISHDNIMGNIISMCELARLHKIKPILCSVPPSTQFGWRRSITEVSEKIVRLNEMIKEYAESQKIVYIDYHSALKDSEGGLPKEYSEDGVHPNLNCYKIMESILLKSLR